MELTVVGSSSKGNGYVIQNDEEAIIIEAGIGLSEIKKALDFNIRKVKGCLISHTHGDHAKYAKSYENVFKCFANSHVIKSRELQNTIRIKPHKGIKIGGFKIYPFDVNHDVPTLGFHISHKDMGNLLFVTDSYLCKYSFTDVNHFLIECNYSDEALTRAIEKGLTNPFMRDRLMMTHMELKTLIKYISAYDLSIAYNLILLHLSRYNSDRAQFIEEIEKTTGKKAVIAESGIKIELLKNPY